MEKLRMEALKRTIKYKEETRQSTKRIVVECIKEMYKGMYKGNRFEENKG